MDWADLRATAFDFETTGTLPEFALQPWRIHQRESDGLTRFSLTSLAVYPDYSKVTGLYPTEQKCREFLEEARKQQALHCRMECRLRHSMLACPRSRS